MLILAIDLGKFNSMCCVFDTKTQKPVFANAPTTRAAIHRVLSSQAFDLVVMEACGPSGWISDVCHELELKTLVCSTNEEAWQWKNVKRKTDRDDALRLAKMTMMRDLKGVHIPKPEIREQRLEQLAKANPHVQRLLQIPGVGRKTAEALVVAIDDPHRFKSGRQLSAYLGLVPKQYQSGQTDRNGRISKRGPRMLRSILLECALVQHSLQRVGETDVRTDSRRTGDAEEKGGYRAGT